ncbi:MAG: helix-turn-helix domain-containing protein [Candidatus Margulisbacteria bacterium]|jgi:transcriptional regulator with XRE-family HTH domain|nr:helix-turn-helix domain-containing protein [Candidatus Margulisiibacteriota bacterium]
MNDIEQLKTHIGRRLKELRLKTGLTIDDFAREVDMAFPNYLYLEKGTKGSPKLETLCKLADFYGVHVDYFFLDYQPSEKLTARLKNKPLEDRLLAEFRKLDTDKRAFYLHMLKSYNQKYGF